MKNMILRRNRNPRMIIHRRTSRILDQLILRIMSRQPRRRTMAIRNDVRGHRRRHLIQGSLFRWTVGVGELVCSAAVVVVGPAARLRTKKKGPEDGEGVGDYGDCGFDH